MRKWLGACLLAGVLGGMAHAQATAPAAPAAPAAPPAPAAPAAPAAPPADGFHTTPSLYWKSGLQRIDLGFSGRLRTEGWDTPSATNPDWDWYTGVRLRLSLRYAYGDRFALFVEGQDASVHGVDSDSAPPVRNYFVNTGLDGRGHGTSLRQAWAEVRPADWLTLRAGRQDIKLGAEVSYAEPNWKYLKASRLGERLIGTVGWTVAERSNDAGTLTVDTEHYELYGFVGRPTTGVFDLDSAYRPLRGIVFGGAELTAKRGAWLPNTELGAFAIAYRDDRATTSGGIPDGLRFYTIGASSVGIYPIGEAQLDAIAWIAGQTGEFGGQRHGAWAGIFEAGLQLPKRFAKPWLRLGANLASGDSDPADGKHGTFFNLLPSNHPYYGFADQLAFENLKDLFVQLRLAPHEKLQLNAFVHYSSLMDANDARYSGGGAFSKSSFGYVASPSGGARTVGVEYDLVATLALHRTTSLELGVAHLEAGRVLPGDVEFAYASLELKY
jgi:hypothetical protein